MSQPKVVHRYRYDPLDRLIETAGIQRFYNTTRMATEIQGAVQHSVFQSGDVLLAQTRREGAQVDCTLLATDFQRSVLHGVSPDKVEPIAYNVYGHRPAHSGLLSVLGFNGERPDPITGHYLLGNGYRAFNPVLMRFNSPDSWSPFGEGGINCYGYCGGDSVNNFDVSGHSATTFFKWAVSRKRYKFFGGSKPSRHKISGVQKVMEGVYVGRDKTKGHPRLIINAHSSSGQFGTHVVSGRRRIDVSELVSNIEQAGVKISDYKSIKMLVCFSAEGEHSLAQQVAARTGLPVKGFSGKVSGSKSPMKIGEHVGGRTSGNFYVRRKEIAWKYNPETKERMTDPLGIYYYSPVVVYPPSSL